MKINRSDVVKLAVGSLIGVALSIAIGSGPLQPVESHIVQISGAGQFCYRLWSDGRIECNDCADLWTGNQYWKGWREVK